MEAVLTGAIPIVPDRASYSEMYLDVFKYPSEWTEDYEAFLKHRDELTAFIDEKIDNAEKYITFVKKQQQILIDNYLNSTVMIDNILK